MPAAFWSPMPTSVLALEVEAAARAAQAIRHATATVRARLRVKPVSGCAGSCARTLRGSPFQHWEWRRGAAFTLTLRPGPFRHLDPCHRLDEEPEQRARNGDDGQQRDRGKSVQASQHER